MQPWKFQKIQKRHSNKLSIKHNLLLPKNKLELYSNQFTQRLISRKNPTTFNFQMAEETTLTIIYQVTVISLCSIRRIIFNATFERRHYFNGYELFS